METNESFEKVGAEVCAVLKSVPSKEYNKVSKNIRNLFEGYSDGSKKIKIDTSKSIEEQNISKEAKDIIFVISLNYWLTEEQKKIALKKLKENEIKMNEKYDIERIFKSKSNRYEEKMEKVGASQELAVNEDEVGKNNTSKALVKSTGKWYNKIFSFFRRIFKRK